MEPSPTNSKKLTLSLRTALIDRNVCQVRALLVTHGLTAFGCALAQFSPRVTADVLSLLKADDRTAVLRHLSSSQRDSLRPLGLVLSTSPAGADSRSPRLLTAHLPWGGRRLLGMAL